MVDGSLDSWVETFQEGLQESWRADIEAKFGEDCAGVVETLLDSGVRARIELLAKGAVDAAIRARWDVLNDKLNRQQREINKLERTILGRYLPPSPPNLADDLRRVRGAISVQATIDAFERIAFALTGGGYETGETD